MTNNNNQNMYNSQNNNSNSSNITIPNISEDKIPDELKLLTKNHYDGVIPIPKTTINDYEPLDPPMRKQKERKYLRRALKYIWSFI